MGTREITMLIVPTTAEVNRTFSRNGADIAIIELDESTNKHTKKYRCEVFMPAKLDLAKTIEQKMGWSQQDAGLSDMTMYSVAGQATSIRVALANKFLNLQFVLKRLKVDCT